MEGPEGKSPVRERESRRHGRLCGLGSRQGAGGSDDAEDSFSVFARCGPRQYGIQNLESDIENEPRPASTIRPFSLCPLSPASCPLPPIPRLTASYLLPPASYLLPPAPCLLPPSAVEHKEKRTVRLLSGYLRWRAGETNRCAVSNVERMRQAFDFYVKRPGGKSFLTWVLRPGGVP
jgi:hypothetical protein